MKEAVLAMTAQDVPKGGARALWQGRDAPDGALCLENMLDERIVRLRAAHMRWACETGADFQQYFKCGDSPSMWWTSLVYERHPKVTPYLYEFYKLACVEIWLEECKAEGLTVIGGEKRLATILRGLCAAKGIKFRAQKGAPAKQRRQNWRQKLYKAIPAPLRATSRFVLWLWQTRLKLPKTPALPKAAQMQGASKPPATIVTYFPNVDMKAAADGRFRSRYWESLHDALNQEARLERPDGPHFVRWLFIYFNSPGISLRKAAKLRDSFQANGGDGLSFNFLEEFLGWKEIRHALMRWARLCWQSLIHERAFAANCATEGSGLNFWPLARWSWAESMRGWRCLERCLFNIAFDRYCQLAGAQRWTLFPLENCPWERMLTEAARRVPGNGPVFGGQHSTIRPTDFRYFDDPRTFIYEECKAFQPDKIAGNGASACGQWLANGMPKDRLAQVEALRYLYLAQKREAEQPGVLPPDRGEPAWPDGLRRMLIATSFFRDETEAHLALVGAAMRAGLLDGWKLVLKAHPYLHPQEWLDSLAPAQRGRIYVSGQPLAAELAPGTTVWASNSTTAALEAALVGLPLMVMAACNDFDLCPIQDAPGLLRTATVADVEQALSRLAPPRLMPGYLNLNPELLGWRRLLGLAGAPSLRL